MIALGIGIRFTISDHKPWFPWLMFFGAFIVAAYNLELFRGFFHNMFWFCVAWGAFPFVCGFLVNDGRDINSLIIGGGFCFWAAFCQRVLSTRARYIRRVIRMRTPDLPRVEGLLAGMCILIPLMSILILMVWP